MFWAHVISGILVAFIGLIQIVRKKEGTLHRFLGRAYGLSWVILLISGIYLGGLLITFIGVFSFYFVVTGVRMAQLKDKEFHWVDRGIFLVGLLIASFMLIYAFYLFYLDEVSFGIILVVFGGIFFWTTLLDVLKFGVNKSKIKQKYGQLEWYFEHMTRMLISYIAAVTAFTSIQNIFRENTLNFLLPTAIGVLLILRLQRKHKKKLDLSSKR